MPELTPPQEKALIEAVTEDWGGLGDAWDNILDDQERALAALAFLAGVKWAEEQHEAER